MTESQNFIGYGIGQSRVRALRLVFLKLFMLLFNFDKNVFSVRSSVTGLSSILLKRL